MNQIHTLFLYDKMKLWKFCEIFLNFKVITHFKHKIENGFR